MEQLHKQNKTKSHYTEQHNHSHIFTRRLCQRGNIKFDNYEDRLQKFKLESLESRRIKNDLTMLYKVLHNVVDVDFDKFFKFSVLGGYNLRRHKLHLKRTSNSKTICHQSFFPNRV